MPHVIDNLGTLVARESQRAALAQLTASWGVVQTYNAVTHEGQVLLQPGDLAVGPLKFLVPFLGLAHPINQGDQCLVLCLQGVPTAVLGVAYGAADPVPTAAALIQGDLCVVGMVRSVGPIEAGPIKDLPPASADLRGALVVLGTSPDGVAGTADTLQVCLQAAGGSLSWKTIATG